MSLRINMATDVTPMTRIPDTARLTNISLRVGRAVAQIFTNDAYVYIRVSSLFGSNSFRVVNDELSMRIQALVLAHTDEAEGGGAAAGGGGPSTSALIDELVALGDENPDRRTELLAVLEERAETVEIDDERTGTTVLVKPDGEVVLDVTELKKREAAKDKEVRDEVSKFCRSIRAAVNSHEKEMRARTQIRAGFASAITRD